MPERMTRDPASPLPPVLRRKIGLARLAAGIETLWPLFALMLSLIALFLAGVWLGLFTLTPFAVRIAAATVFVSAAAWVLWRIACWRTPDSAEGSKRLDLSDPALHRPLEALADRPSGDDPVAAELWRRHQARAARAAEALQVPPPKSLVPGRDRFAFRALALLAMGGAAFVAGDERMSRLADVFAWRDPAQAATPPRLDVWIDPPAYTGRAPIFLSGTQQEAGPVSAPVGSVAVIRVAPGDGVTLTASPNLKPKEAEATSATASPAPAQPARPAVPAAFEKRVTITGDGMFEVRGPGGLGGRYDIRAIPDLPPSVVFTEIESEDRGQTLKLKYTLNDDYGIAKTEAVIARAGATGRTLVPPPEITLGGRIGENEAALATQEHPWAGVRVTIRLRASDDIGQTAESETREAVLPARRFENAIAKALIEQRRNIVIAPDDRRRVAVAIDGLMVAPDKFAGRSGDYLMLSIAQRKLRDARTDADLVAFAQYLWETALAMDEGLLSDAERALRAAEDRLRDAIERGAPQDEISRLMNELRQAMNEFLREFAERNRDQQNADRNDRQDPNRTLTQRDLDDMLKQIEEMLRKSDTAQAQEMLRQLQEMMRNLRSAQRQQGDPRMREMGEALDELEKMLREQENLRDETFRDNQRRRDRAQQRGQRGQQPGQQGQRGQRQPGQQGQQQDGEGQDGEDGEGEEGQQGQQGGGKSLAERQQELRDRLNRMRERMRRQGMGEQEGLEGADEGMGSAEQNLRQRQGGRATQGQQQAIDGLGQAGRGLSQQMQQEMGDGTEMGDGQDGMGPGNPDPNNRRGRADSRNTDPLGRPLPNRGDQLDNSRVKIPQSGDVIGTGERARRVLEELRKRFGESERPREELDYIERLLPRN